MPATVRVYLEHVNDFLATYTTIRLYRGTTPDGLSITSTLAATATLVEDQQVYELDDADGSVDSWYAYELYHPTGPVRSTLSPSWQVDAVSAALLILEAAKACKAGFSSVSGASSTTTKLHDPKFRLSGIDANFLAGVWILRPNAAEASDRVNRVVPNTYDPTAATVDMAETWTNAPAEDEAYYGFMLAPPLEGLPGQPMDWMQALNDGLKECRYPDMIQLGVGASYNRTDFSLAPHLGYLDPDSDVQSVFVRHVADAANAVYVDADWSAEGRFWTIIQNQGDVQVRLHPAPPADDQVWMHVLRQGSQVYRLSDYVRAPIDQARFAAAWKMLDYLADNGQGEYAQQAESMRREFMTRRDREQGNMVVRW